MELIFDIGSNNGDDIKYYCLKADKVVAFEANPELCRLIVARYGQLVSKGQLIVENAVLCAEHDTAVETVDFYIHKREHVLSQFPKPSTDEIDDFDCVRVPVITLGSAIDRYGVPSYAKIDVEHYDHVLVKEFFRLGIYPEYLSAECHSREVVSSLLGSCKYQGFKLVDGESVARQYRDVKIIDKSGGTVVYSFPFHSAGPFGNDISGPWMDRKSMRRKLSSTGLGWRDLHASRVDTGFDMSTMAVAIRYMRTAVGFLFFARKQ